MQTIFDGLKSVENIKIWPKLMSDMSRYGMFSLSLIMGVPVGSLACTIICTPLTFIAVTGLFITVLKTAMPTHDEL